MDFVTDKVYDGQLLDFYVVSFTRDPPLVANVRTCFILKRTDSEVVYRTEIKDGIYVLPLETSSGRNIFKQPTEGCVACKISNFQPPSIVIDDALK